MATTAPVVSKSLAPTERTLLAQLEAQVAEDLQAFIRAGSALAEINVKRLYREGYRNFTDYCRERWGMSDSRAYQLVAAAATAREVSTIVGTSPANEAQVRPLARLPAEEQREAWKEAVESAPDGRVTAKHVEAVVEKRKPKEPEPEEHPEYGSAKESEPDPYVEIERLAKELEEKDALVESLSQSDLGKELRAQQAKYAALSGRLDQEVTRANEAVRQAKWAMGQLNKIKAFVGVSDARDVLPALESRLR